MHRYLTVLRASHPQCSATWLLVETAKRSASLRGCRSPQPGALQCYLVVLGGGQPCAVKWCLAVLDASHSQCGGACLSFEPANRNFRCLVIFESSQVRSSATWPSSLGAIQAQCAGAGLLSPEPLAGALLDIFASQGQLRFTWLPSRKPTAVYFDLAAPCVS